MTTEEIETLGRRLDKARQILRTVRDLRHELAALQGSSPQDLFRRGPWLLSAVNRSLDARAEMIELTKRAIRAGEQELALL